MAAALACCILPLLLLGGTASAAPKERTSFQWKQYELAYPADWRLARNEERGGTRFVEFRPSEKWPLRLFFTFFSHTPEPDENYRSRPAMAGLSMGLPLALRLAGKAGEKAISLSFGSIELSTGPQPSARLRILLPDEQGAVHLECFLFAQTGAMFAGIIRTDISLGQVMGEKEFHDLVAQVYQAIRTLRITPAG